MLLVLSLSPQAVTEQFNLAIIQFRLAFLSGGLFQDPVPTLLCFVLMKLLGYPQGEVFFFVSHSRGWGMIPLRRSFGFLFFFFPLLSELRIHLTFLG